MVDEQHRFGLHQRTALSGKGAGDVDVLIMTATPIPRTLALTYYGDLDVAVIDELPAGRRPVQTIAARTAQDRAAAETLVRDEVAAGHQAFVVCAAIDEGNRTRCSAAEVEAERLRTDVFPELEVALLHGRMRPKEKERAMERFRAGDADVLISTTVIEVGVDVPNATVMLVENAERFGLAQLHQLRGRIGRGDLASTCILFDASEASNEEARARIDAMVRTTDGFELADEDLRLRGEGTLFDMQQSGMPDLKLARLAEDVDLVGRARARAFALIDDDPELVQHPALPRRARAIGSHGRSTGSSARSRRWPRLGGAGRLARRAGDRRDRQGDRGSRPCPRVRGRCPTWRARGSSPASVPRVRTRPASTCSPAPARRGSRRCPGRGAGDLRRPRPPERPRRSDPNLGLTGFEAVEDGRADADVAGGSRDVGAQATLRCSCSRPPVRARGDALGDLLAALDAGWLAPEGWTVVVTRGHKSSQPVVPVHWAVRRQLRYGDSLLTQYREERWA